MIRVSLIWSGPCLSQLMASWRSYITPPLLSAVQTRGDQWSVARSHALATFPITRSSTCWLWHFCKEGEREKLLMILLKIWFFGEILALLLWSAIIKMLLSSYLCLQFVTSRERLLLQMERAGSDLGFLIGWGGVWSRGAVCWPEWDSSRRHESSFGVDTVECEPAWVWHVTSCVTLRHPSVTTLERPGGGHWNMAPVPHVTCHKPLKSFDFKSVGVTQNVAEERRRVADTEALAWA